LQVPRNDADKKYTHRISKDESGFDYDSDPPVIVDTSEGK
jgi:hypothetical protein